MNKLKIFFVDFWSDFDFNDNLFINPLREDYEVEIDSDNPDILFFSVFGNKHNFYNCKKVFFTGENIRPDFNKCDFAFSFDIIEDEPRNYRLPQYYQYYNPEGLLDKPDIDRILKEKTRFCNFIYSNPNCPKRNNFFKKLSKYKRVDSAGRFWNNIGHYLGPTVEDKYDFIRQYKFSISFENEEYPYYTTEKIYQPMMVDSLPIYWGNPHVSLDFNTESFLNYYDYGSDEALIERIIEVDNNQDLYIEYLKKPWFKNNELNPFVRKENIKKQLKYIVESDITPVSSKSSIFSTNPLTRKSSRIVNNIQWWGHRMMVKIKGFNLRKLKMKYDLLKYKLINKG